MRGEEAVEDRDVVVLGVVLLRGGWAEARGTPTKCCWELCTLRDCLCYLDETDEDGIEVWLMTECEGEKSWRKEYVITDKLRTLGGTAKLVFDVIQFDSELEKAIIFAVGNTLVCDDLDEAKHLSWSGQRFKVVTTNGILLTKSGTMTGGTSGGMEARSHK